MDSNGLLKDDPTVKKIINIDVLIFNIAIFFLLVNKDYDVYIYK